MDPSLALGPWPVNCRFLFECRPGVCTSGTPISGVCTSEIQFQVCALPKFNFRCVHFRYERVTCMHFRNLISRVCTSEIRFQVYALPKRTDVCTSVNFRQPSIKEIEFNCMHFHAPSHPSVCTFRSAYTCETRFGSAYKFLVCTSDN